MRKLLLPALAVGMSLLGGAALAHPHGYQGGYYDGRWDGRGHSHRGWRDSDRDGRPDQWDRYDNRRDRHYRGYSRYDRRYDGYRY